MKPSQLAKLQKSDPEAYELALKKLAKERERAESIKTDDETAQPETFISPAMKVRQQPKRTKRHPVTSVDRSPSSYDVVLAAVKQVRELLSGKSESEKIEIKQRKLPEFQEFIDDYIDSGVKYSNQVLVWVTIWLLDIGEIDAAYKYAIHAIEQQQIAPENFKRPLTDVFSEMIFEWAEKKFKTGESAAPYLIDTCEKVNSNEWPVTQPIISSKLFVLQSRFDEQIEDWAEVVRWCDAAQKVNPDGAGVKTRTAKAKSNLENK